MLFGKHINRYYLKYAPLFILGILALVAVDIIQLFVPEYLGEVVKILQTPDSDRGRIMTLGIYVLIVAAGMFLGRFLWRVTLFNAAFRIEADMRHKMFLKAESLPRQYYHETKVGSIMSWFTNDLETISEYFSWGTIMMVDAVFLSIITVIKMVRLDIWMTVICFAPLLLVALWGFLCERFFMKRWDERQNAYDKVYDFAQENFTGIRVIKAFVKERQQIHKFNKLALANSEANVKFTYISVLFDVLIGIIVALVSAIILGFGGWFVYATVTHNPIVMFGYQIELEPGQLVTFQGYFYTLVWPMIALGQVITMFSKARTSYRRVANFLDIPINIKDNENAKDVEIKGNIKLDHFSFRYEGASKDSLKDISLEIKEGELIGIVGAVGSGKSTLVNTLTRLYNVNKNQVYIDDNDIMDIKLSSLREGFAYSPQDNFLFSGSIKENIIFDNNNLDEVKLRGAILYSDLKKDLDEFENKEDTVIAENGATISGGQKQRISLARAFYKDSQILILDDVVSAVDLKTEQNILKNLKEQRAGKTTIIVASRVSTVMGADKVIVLNKGSLEAFDTPSNLLKQEGTFSRMVLLQQLSTKKGE